MPPPTPRATHRPLARLARFIHIQQPLIHPEGRAIHLRARLHAATVAATMAMAALDALGSRLATRAAAAFIFAAAAAAAWRVGLL